MHAIAQFGLATLSTLAGILLFGLQIALGAVGLIALSVGIIGIAGLFTLNPTAAILLGGIPIGIGAFYLETALTPLTLRCFVSGIQYFSEAFFSIKHSCASLFNFKKSSPQPQKRNSQNLLMNDNLDSSVKLEKITKEHQESNDLKDIANIIAKSLENHFNKHIDHSALENFKNTLIDILKSSLKENDSDITQVKNLTKLALKIKKAFIEMDVINNQNLDISNLDCTKAKLAIDSVVLSMLPAKSLEKNNVTTQPFSPTHLKKVGTGDILKTQAKHHSQQNQWAQFSFLNQNHKERFSVTSSEKPRLIRSVSFEERSTSNAQDSKTLLNKSERRHSFSF